MSVIRNPWLWVFLASLIPVPAAWYFGATSDAVLDWISIVLFIVIGSFATVYLQRAPYVVRDGDFEPPARNLVGWTLISIGIGAYLFYSFYFRSLGRPTWLSSQFYLASIWMTVLVGFALMVSSTRRNNAPLVTAKPTGFALGLLTATVIGLFTNAGHFLGIVWKAVVAFIVRAG